MGALNFIIVGMLYPTHEPHTESSSHLLPSVDRLSYVALTTFG